MSKDAERNKLYTRAYYRGHKEQVFRRNEKRYKSRQRFLDALKRTAGCIDCGYNESAVALDFDHVRGVKEYNISKNIGLAWDKLLSEISKCDVRCANCHRVVTLERKMERMY